MPIDPSIPLSARAPQINTPFENLGQMMQLQQQSQQMRSQQALEESRRQDIEKQRKAEAERERLNQIIGNPNLTRESFLDQVRTKAPSAYFDAVKQFDEQDKRAIEIKNSQQAFDNAKAVYAEKQQGYTSGLAAAVKANDYNPAAFELALKHAESTFPDFSERANEYRQFVTENGPSAIQQIVNGLIAQTPQVASEVRQATEQAITLPSRTPNAQGLTPSQAEAARPKVGTLEEFILSTTGKPQAQLSPTDRTRLKAQWEAAGRAPERPNDSPLVSIVGTDGKPILVRREDAIGKAPASGTMRPASGIQKRVLNFFNRAQQADTELEALETEIQKMGIGGQARMEYAPNFAQSQLGQSATAAQRAFTEARLRKDSGAAIPVQEFNNDRRTYFTQPGDSEETIQQKRRGRAAILASLAFESGEALGEFVGDMDEAKRIMDSYKARAAKPKTEGAQSAAPAAGRVRVKGPNGQTGTMPASSALPPGWSRE